MIALLVAVALPAAVLEHRIVPDIPVYIWYLGGLTEVLCFGIGLFVGKWLEVLDQ